MRKSSVIAISLFAALLAVLPVKAQGRPNTVAKIFFVTPKGGAEQQFLAGMKKHMQWLGQQKETWSWFTWEIVSGPRTGQVVIGTFGHDWKDFDGRDQFNQAADADAEANIAPYVQSYSVSYYGLMPDLSRMPAHSSQPASGNQPSAYARVTTYFLKPGRQDNLAGVIHAVNDAIKNNGYPARPDQWFSLLNGGYGPQWVSVVPEDNWADFQPPQQDFGDMMDKNFGKLASEDLFHKYSSSFRETRTEIFHYIPELSYIPAAQ